MSISVLFPRRLKVDPCTQLAQRYIKYAGRFEQITLEQVNFAKLTGKKRADLVARLQTVQSFALTEHGRGVDTPWFAQTVLTARNTSRPLVFLVGDAYGVPADLLAACSGTLSLTPLTLPHEMALAILLEQLWRGLAIVHGHPYHK